MLGGDRREIVLAVLANMEGGPYVKDRAIPRPYPETGLRRHSGSTSFYCRLGEPADGNKSVVTRYRSAHRRYQPTFHGVCRSIYRLHRFR